MIARTPLYIPQKAGSKSLPTVWKSSSRSTEACPTLATCPIVEGCLSGYFFQPPPALLPPCDREDLRASICRLNSHIPPPGQIDMTKSPPLGVAYALNLYNACLRLHYFPRLWQSDSIIIIPKPSKPPMNPGNYRLISLLPVISKVF